MRAVRAWRESHCVSIFMHARTARTTHARTLVVTQIRSELKSTVANRCRFVPRVRVLHCLFTYARLVPNLLLGAWLTYCGAMAEVAILFEVLLGKRSRSCTRVMCVCRSPACRLQITSLVTFLLYFQDCTAKNRCSVAIL